MKLKLGLACLLAALCVTALGTTAAQARVRHCDTAADFNLRISSARNMTCAAARTTLRKHKGSISRRFHVAGFSCYRVSGNALGGQWRCVRGMRAFRFEFGD